MSSSCAIRAFAQRLKSCTVFLAAAALAAGCASLPPDDLFETDQGREILASVKSRHSSSLGVAVAIDAEETGNSREDFGNAAQVAVDPKALRARFASALSKLGLFERVVELGGDEALYDEGSCVSTAKENGLDWVMVLRPTKSRVSFRGRNSWFIPSLALWVLFWFPSLWVADEDYAADVSFNCAFFRTGDGAEIRRGDWPGGFQAALNDFQRNIIFWGILRVPGALDVGDYEDIGELLTAHAWNAAMAPMLKDLVSMVESGLPSAPRPGTSPDVIPPKPGPGPNGGKQPDPGGNVQANPPEVAKPALPQRKAIVIGAGSFSMQLIAPVPFATADASAFADALAAHSGFKSGEIASFTGEGADLASVKAAIESLKGEGHEDDVIVIYFSGRGFAQKGAAGDRLFLALRDTDPSSLSLTALLLSDLRTVLASRKGRVTLVLDTSFSGADAPRAAGTGSKDPAAALRSIFAGRTGWACLFAAGNGGAAHDLDESSTGLFTHFLVRGLAGEAGKNRGGVSLALLSDFLAGRVPRMADFLGEPQNPLVAGDDMSRPVVPTLE